MLCYYAGISLIGQPVSSVSRSEADVASGARGICFFLHSLLQNTFFFCQYVNVFTANSNSLTPVYSGVLIDSHRKYTVTVVSDCFGRPKSESLCHYSFNWTTSLVRGTIKDTCCWKALIDRVHVWVFKSLHILQNCIAMKRERERESTCVCVRTYVHVHVRVCIDAQ